MEDFTGVKVSADADVKLSLPPQGGKVKPFILDETYQPLDEKPIHVTV